MKSVRFVLPLLVCLGVAVAQDAPPASSKGDQSGTTADAKNGSDAKGSGAPAAASSGLGIAEVGEDAAVKTDDQKLSESPIRQLGRAVPLTIQPGFWHIGPFYLASVGAQQIYGQFTPNFGPSHDSWTTMGSASVFYMHQFRREHSMLAFQYSPSIAVSGGQFVSNLTGNNLGFNTSLALTRRLTWSLADNFSYYGSQFAALQAGIDSDFLTGAVVQNQRLERPGSYYNENFTTSMHYGLSQRTSIDFSPDFGYIFTNSYAGPGQSGSGIQYGGAVSLSRAITERTGAGVSWGMHRSVMNALGSSATMYQRVGLTGSHVFGHDWNVHAFVGIGGLAADQHQHWTPDSSISLTKQFRRSGISLAYSRTSTFLTLLRNGYADEFDGSVFYNITRTTTISVGGSDYSQIWGTSGSVHAINAMVTHGLTRSVSLFGSYMYRTQGGNPLELLLGRRTYASVGISWAPGQHDQPRF